MAIVSTGAVTFFSSVNIITGNEDFYKKYVIPIVHKLPPETAHRFAIFACKYKLLSKTTFEDPKTLETHFLGWKLTNPIGIAAGFDKQGEAIETLQNIGFGFVEIGSVTPLPQSGNPKPRVFRDVNDMAIINRYGFNSDGHDEVFKRLKHLRDQNDFIGLIGVNLGKNKNSDNALHDYSKGILAFAPVADYLVINVSSPNTPGLRNLQGKEELQNLLSGAVKVRNSLPYAQKRPILLKLAPDLTLDQLRDVVVIIKQKECHVDGLIISNTTLDKSKLKDIAFASEDGGLSGKPLKSKSTELIANVYALTKGTIPIIGVGGIFTGQDAFEKIEAGASALQIYTAFALHGPPVINSIKQELDAILTKKGFPNVAAAVGSNYKKYSTLGVDI